MPESKTFAASLVLSIGNDLGEVAEAILAFGDFAEQNALPAAVRRSMSVVLDELLANTVSYGLAGRDDGEVKVDIKMRSEDRLTVTLTDNGKPFDPFSTGRATPDTTLSVEERQIGGLGIHLVQKLVDEVTYQRRGDTNVVVLVKLLASSGSVSLADGHRGGRLMEIKTRAQDDITIVAITGNLDSITSPEAQQALEAVLAAGGRKIAVDFSALDYISSAGLRVMLGVAKRLMATGGALRTFGLNDTVREVFDISGFSTILAVYPSEDEARKGF